MEAKVISHHSILHKLLENRCILQIPRVILINGNDMENFSGTNSLAKGLLAQSGIRLVELVLQSDGK